MDDVTIDELLARVRTRIRQKTPDLGDDFLGLNTRLSDAINTVQRSARSWETSIQALRLAAAEAAARQAALDAGQPYVEDQVEDPAPLTIPVRAGAPLGEMLATAIAGATRTAAMIPPPQLLALGDDFGRINRALYAASIPAAEFDKAVAAG